MLWNREKPHSIPLMNSTTVTSNYQTVKKLPCDKIRRFVYCKICLEVHIFRPFSDYPLDVGDILLWLKSRAMRLRNDYLGVVGISWPYYLHCRTFIIVKINLKIVRDSLPGFALLTERLPQWKWARFVLVFPLAIFRCFIWIFGVTNNRRRRIFLIIVRTFLMIGSRISASPATVISAFCLTRQVIGAVTIDKWISF